MAQETLVPRQLPSDRHAVVVVLESGQVAPPDIDTSPLTHEALVYKHTAKDEVAARIRDASVVFTTVSPVTAEAIGQAPYLKAVFSYSAGVDHIDVAACKARGIKVFNSPGCAAEAVAGHAIALYFALRRSLVPLGTAMRDFDGSRPNGWKTGGSLVKTMLDGEHQLPNTCSQEVVGVFGYGKIGTLVASLCRALGMQVLVAGRKGSKDVADGRTPFDDVVRTATVLVLALPLTAETADLIAAPELARMRPDAVLVNISRGGVVGEAAVLAALQERRIFGYGTDVFDREPAGGAADSVLLAEPTRGLNLVLTPHIAWASDLTKENVKAMLKRNIRLWVEGAPGNVA